MKPVFLLSNSNITSSSSQVGHNNLMAHSPYAYTDPYYGGLLTTYGPQVLPQMVGVAPSRVPLPFDLAEDGPIYVNAKQYHGILRRRQSRAKLEAQNRLIKTRKPYLHESRHIHALNRIRGSGGRFLSNKKLQQADSNHATTMNSEKLQKDTSETQVHQSGFGEYASMVATHSDITSVSDGVTVFQQSGHELPDVSPHMGGALQCSGRLLHGRTTQHRDSIVR